DIARQYQAPAAAEKLIDEAAAAKINTFHLHLSDDQGFRIVINGFPNLTSIGAQGSVGTDGRTMDPGGFWTQAQFKAVVAYAAARFITVVPEVDSPGHTNAIIMSEYNDTANPLLNGHPSDINCSTNKPPQWNYTGDVGYSALCPTSDNTWTILSSIISQLSAMASSTYYDIGGDEVPATVLTQEQYASFVTHEGGIVNGVGKTVMGWADIAGDGTTLAPGSVAEYWNPASGSSGGTATATEAVAKGMKLIMAPANHAYLDQKYARNTPANLGLTWACGRNGCDVDQFYNWDPASYVTGVTDADVIGVEGALWSETVRNISESEYMIYPRLLALAELGWSPKVDRTSTSPAYQDFLVRLAAQGARLTAAGTNFYPSTEVPWRLDLTAAQPGKGAHGHGPGAIGGTLATLSAPGVPADAITATIDWGDGTSSTGTVTGTAATPTSVNGLYSISGSHTFRGHRHARAATLTVAAPGKASVTMRLDLGKG
ncbi:MAG: family 20 glycosylhydrolase, partial [Sciscionella sp.]